MPTILYSFGHPHVTTAQYRRLTCVWFWPSFNRARADVFGWRRPQHPDRRARRPRRVAKVTLKPPADLDDVCHRGDEPRSFPTLCSRNKTSREQRRSAARRPRVVGSDAAPGGATATWRMLHDPVIVQPGHPRPDGHAGRQQLNKASSLAEEDLVQTIRPAALSDGFIRPADEEDRLPMRKSLKRSTDHDPLNSPTCAAYKRLRDDPVLLERLHAAPSYAEPRSRSGIRAANPLEFLFQMVAVDRPDAELCAKVSPNATFADTGEIRRCFRIEMLSLHRIQYARCLAV